MSATLAVSGSSTSPSSFPDNCTTRTLYCMAVMAGP
eukprot:CAMPEP_0181506578 /NCGR_PEP_ID=MMETSP1110-20121109/58670_1 /TAXON_ID=174948 /ORGANISM="Symbiodinium sp., Strain CCMP421" /LENGTH=35 /DNA_ID= /DNA_START= /DNA_END= /DNA_ORIENTATION=